MSIKAISKMIWLIIAIVIIAIAGLGAALYYTMKPAATARNVFRVGVPVEITGAWAREGNMILRGYDAWKDYTNENMGGLEIDGTKYQIEYVYYDLKSDVSTAADAVNKMITTSDIDWIWGPMASSSVLAEAGTCDRYGMLQIDGTCESHLIPEQHFNYTFTLQPITKSNGVGTVNLFKLIPEVHKIAFIYSDAAFNTGLGEGLQLAIDDANAHGSNYTVVYKEVFSDASTDLSSQVLKAKLANPDAFVVYAYATHCLISTRNMKEQNFSPKLCVQYSGITEPEVVTTLGKDAEDYAAAVSWTASTNWPSIVSPLWGNNSNYLNYFTTKFGVKGDYSSAGCAAVGEIMQVLLQRYHITPPLTQADRDQIKTALESGEIFNTFFGPAKFEMDSIFWHSNKGQMVQVQVQNGTVYVVGPVAIREKPIVYPRPTWAELAALP